MQLCLLQILIFSVYMLAFCDVGAEEEGIMQGMTRSHNNVRTKVGVRGLVWSDELASFAQEWAEYLARETGCAMQHRPRQGPFANVYGENLYWASAIRWSNGKKDVQKINPEKVVRNWAKEAADYSYLKNSCKQGKACGHYTQVVWKQTKKVGCGRAVCEDKSQVWVCNYDPPGNYIGQKPY